MQPPGDHSPLNFVPMSRKDFFFSMVQPTPNRFVNSFKDSWTTIIFVRYACRSNNSCSFVGQGDYFAFEMLEGFLYLHLELGSGGIKLRCSNRKLDDGAWHRVDLIRNLRMGSVAVDNDDDIDFETIGEEDSLDLGGPLYVGAVDRTATHRYASSWSKHWTIYNSCANIQQIMMSFSVEGSARGGYHRRGSIRPATMPRQWVPPALWSATIKKGFVGCLRDLVINQVTVDVADYASKQDSGK